MTRPVIEEYAEFVNSTCWYVHADEGNAKEMAYVLAGVAGEAGETLDTFKKIIREAGFDDDGGFIQLLSEGQGEDLVDELGDVLWYVVRACKVLNISLETLMMLNTLKLFGRLRAKELIGDEFPWPFSDPFKTHENVGTMKLMQQKGRERRLEKWRNNSQ